MNEKGATNVVEQVIVIITVMVIIIINVIINIVVINIEEELFVCWLLNVPATDECISGMDLLRQLFVLPH